MLNRVEDPPFELTEQIFSQKIQRLPFKFPEARLVNAHSGRRIFYADDPAEHVYFVAEGRVKAFTSGQDYEHGNPILRTLSAPAFLGEAALSNTDTYGYNASAESYSQLIRLSPQVFQEAILKDPHLGILTFESLAQQQKKMYRLLSDVARKQVVQRVAEFLIEHTGNTDNGVFKGTQLQIAEHVLAGRQSAVKALKALKNAGVIRVSPKSVTVVDPKKLQQYT